MAEAAKKKGWRTRDIVLALVLVVLIGGLVTARILYSPHRIPSGSMAPTLIVGEYVVTPNAAPHVRAGDVVFHAQTSEPGRTFVRRVIAMPGQRIAFREGVPIVDGVALAQTESGERGPEGERIMRETLAGRSYLVAYRDDAPISELREMTERVVPDGQVFLVGDARDNAADSRVVGAQPLTNIKTVGGWILFSPADGRAGRRIE